MPERPGDHQRRAQGYESDGEAAAAEEGYYVEPEVWRYVDREGAEQGPFTLAVRLFPPSVGSWVD